MNNNGRCWETTDLYLAAALRCRDHELLDIRCVARKAVFVYARTSAFTEDVKSFYTDHLTVAAQSYASAIRDTKSAIFDTLGGAADAG